QTHLLRKELSAFLRAKRSQISPQQKQLPSSGLRRTPGLRREEVAELAGVSTTWYTWLEQGREVNPSAETLLNIAQVLNLDELETKYLFTLSGRPLRTHQNIQDR